jgi:predicted RNA binding protein YcfA (HicA-like mRNA interferase family)
MSKFEKAIAKLHQNPQNVSFGEIDRILLRLGFEKRQKGSHAVYTREGSYPITIPFKKPFILPVYVKKVLQIIEEVQNEIDE